MTTQAIITCVILVITMVLLISQKVPLVILGAASPQHWPPPALSMPAALHRVRQHHHRVLHGSGGRWRGLLQDRSGRLYRRQDHRSAGQDRKGLLLGTGLVAGGLSAFLNDTGSTACLMPIVSSMASKAGVKKSKLLMALAFFASLGGTITLVGTTPTSWQTAS
mgnify:CR=1 FL=1